MTIELLPYFTRHLGAGYEPVTTAPDYVRTRRASRWHRARNGIRFPSGRVIYLYWCGPNSGDFGTDEIPADDDLCGTCEGRWQAQFSNRLKFTPLASLPPRRCPAERSEYWVPRDHNRGPFACLVCGAEVRMTAVSRYYAGVKVSCHQTGPTLVPGCPVHGWNYLRLIDDEVRCACGRTS